MALTDTTWYVNYGNGSNTGYYAVTPYANGAYTAGTLLRQLTAPAVGSERVFVVTTAGTATSEPTWTNTRGALNSFGGAGVCQEVTGQASVNGDLTNTTTWATFASAAVTLGQVVKRSTNASYWICTIAGTAGASEPAWPDNTAGSTRTDNTVTWTCIGAVGAFTGWQAPHARLANALASTWGAVGNTFYVASAHAETQAAALTLTAPGTAASPNNILCVNAAGSVPPVAANLTTGASITATGNFSYATGGYFYAYGISFVSGQNFTMSNAASYQRYDSCSFAVGTNGTPDLVIGISTSNVQSKVDWNNCTVNIGTATRGIYFVSVDFTWRNTASAVAGTPPNILFKNVAGTSITSVTLEGVDLSAMSGKIIVDAISRCSKFYLKDCKLPASVTVQSTPTGQGLETFVIRSDSAATNYRSEQYNYQATRTIETSIVRTGGASDGTTPISWKIATTANSSWIFPFQSIPIAIWNASTGSVTVTIQGTWQQNAVPNNDDIWIVAEYLGSSLTPQGSFSSETKANILTTATALTASSASWGGGGSGAGWSPFALTTTFTPGMAGTLYVYVYAANASKTFYVDPYITLS